MQYIVAGGGGKRGGAVESSICIRMDRGAETEDQERQGISDGSESV